MIRFENVTKVYDQKARPALDSINLEIDRGEFAFLVGIPTMFAATAFEFLKARGAEPVHENWTALAVAFVVSAVVAFIVVRWLLRYVQTHRFTVFAWYRIVAGIILLAIVR